MALHLVLLCGRWLLTRLYECFQVVVNEFLAVPPIALVRIWTVLPALTMLRPCRPVLPIGTKPIASEVVPIVIVPLVQRSVPKLGTGYLGG
jgi:hypothetical protein